MRRGTQPEKQPSPASAWKEVGESCSALSPEWQEELVKVTHRAPHWGQFMVKVIFDKLEGDSQARKWERCIQCWGALCDSPCGLPRWVRK